MRKKTFSRRFRIAGAGPAQVRLPAGEQGDNGLGPGGPGSLSGQGVHGVRHEP